MQNNIVRCGVLSTANIALKRLIPAARESSNSEVVAISSRDASKARAAAEDLDIPTWYGSYAELIADPDPRRRNKSAAQLDALRVDHKGGGGGQAHPL